jgi:hypothetical protein
VLVVHFVRVIVRRGWHIEEGLLRTGNWVGGQGGLLRQVSAMGGLCEAGVRVWRAVIKGRDSVG